MTAGSVCRRAAPACRGSPEIPNAVPLFLSLIHIFSLMLWDAFDSAFKCILKEELACRINAEKLLKYLIICLGEKSPVVVR